ncbi:hypothetical protein BBP40_005013 [Aspergillus hancockii]|nr:hypothetical protein BBP40_005013 [Aspergillus hancockii]
MPILACATQRGHVGMAKLLIDAGADVNARGGGADTRPIIRRIAGLAIAVRLLIPKANIDLGTLLDVAEEHDCGKVVTLLLILGVKKGALDSDGNPFIHQVIIKNHLITVMALLDAGVSNEIRGKRGFTPLTQAVVYNRPEIVEALLERHADTEARNDDGDTPLLLAAKRGCIKPAKLLLEKGAGPNGTHKNGYTPLSCCYWGHIGVVFSLLDDDDAPLENMEIPQRGRGFAEIVQMLLCRGSNAIQTPACTGQTPLSYADANKNKQPSGKCFHGKLQSIFDLLHSPSQAAVDWLLVSKGRRSKKTRVLRDTLLPGVKHVR